MYMDLFKFNIDVPETSSALETDILWGTLNIYHTETSAA